MAASISHSRTARSTGSSWATPTRCVPIHGLDVSPAACTSRRRISTPHASPGRTASGPAGSSPGDSIYELHIGTFTPEGTLDAAIGRLDHLVDLGVTHVELLPVNDFNGQWNWGYDGVLWYAVHEAYGGPAAYQRFVNAAHAVGLAVVQDVVYNHLGPSGNYLPEFGPYLRDASRNTWGFSVNLDEPAVRAHILDNALMWLRDYHVDGLRLDAVHALKDDSPIHILQGAGRDGRCTLRPPRPAAHPHRRVGSERPEAHPSSRGGRLWACRAVERRLASRGPCRPHGRDGRVLRGLRGRRVAAEGLDGRVLPRRLVFVVPGKGAWLPDPPRGADVAPGHLRAGSRPGRQPRCRRSAVAVAPRSGVSAVAAVLTLTAPGTPMLFQGEEWGASTPWPFFTSHPEPDLAEATARGRIDEFARMGWDPLQVPDAAGSGDLQGRDPALGQNARAASMRGSSRSIAHSRACAASIPSSPILPRPISPRERIWEPTLLTGRTGCAAARWRCSSTSRRRRRRSTVSPTFFWRRMPRPRCRVTPSCCRRTLRPSSSSRPSKPGGSLGVRAARSDRAGLSERAARGGVRRRRGRSGPSARWDRHR